MLLYDKMLSIAHSKLAKQTGDGDGIIDDLESLQVIVANNVSSFFFEVSEKNEWNLYTDFPNMAPPFEKFFIEFRVPKNINSGGRIIASGAQQGKIGLMFYATTKVDNEPLRKLGAKWVMQCVQCFSADNSSEVIQTGFAQIAVKEDGSIVDAPHGYIVGIRPEQAQVQDRVMGFLTISLHVAFLTLSLLHCKNVEMKTVIPSAPLSKKYQKKTGRPLVKYKVLEIEPMKKVLRTEGQSETLGLKHALHICRGHFKDYSKGGGLFGKYKGLYWWESHVRGDPSQGVVVKDYNVNAPKKQ